MQHAYEYQVHYDNNDDEDLSGSGGMTPTKWIGIKLEPQCDICEARGCHGHGDNEIELKAFCRKTDVDNFELTSEYQSYSREISKDAPIPSYIKTEQERAAYIEYLGIRNEESES